MNKHKIFLVVLWVYAMGCSEETPETLSDDGKTPDVDSLFSNPILASGPDPWVFQKDDNYFLTITTGINVTLYQTQMMSDLSGATRKVIWNPPAVGMNSKNIWAPEIHWVNDKWYIYYAADDGVIDNHRMWVLENQSENPMDGEWLDQGKLDLPEDKYAIDGTIFQHKGQLYYLWSGWEGDVNGRQDIYIVKMSDPLTPTGDRVRLVKPDLDWEKNGTLPIVVEGPQFLAKDDQVFIVYSAGACWSDDYALGMVTAASESDLMSPDSWSKSPNPVFAKNTQGHAFGPGHNGFFKSMDGSEDWLVYHANTYQGMGCGDNRSIRIQRFEWNDEGYPEFGIPESLGNKLTRPKGENDQ